MSVLIENLKSVYADLSLETVDHLEPLYHPDVEFIDPANRIVGRHLLLPHFKSVYENVTYCTFRFIESESFTGDYQAYLSWQMEVRHKNLNSGNSLFVDGVSLLRYNQTITYHRDWFDLGAMVYEHVPLVGRVIRKIKKRLVA